MATYKVIQDIEADDQFVGPLTLKQFVFGMIGVLFLWLNFFAVTRGFALATIVLVPPMLLGFFLAFPWSRDQPTEIWLLAKLRYYFKPRKQVWDQTGMEELVTITVPKKEEKQVTDNLSQNEVKSRLQALAQTIDSRGWAIKDASATYAPYQAPAANDSDRLVGVGILPHEVPIMDTSTITDVYVDNTATSQNLDRMIEQSNEIRKAQNLEKMNRIRSGEPLESIQVPEVHITPPSEQAPALPTVDEKLLTEELKARRAPDSLMTAHMRTIQPIGQDDASSVAPFMPADNSSYTGPAFDDNTSTATTTPTQDDNSADQTDTNLSAPAVPTAPNPAILEYAGNNDLNIATIARQAKKDQEDDGEVVISLR